MCKLMWALLLLPYLVPLVAPSYPKSTLSLDLYSVHILALAVVRERTSSYAGPTVRRTDGKRGTRASSFSSPMPLLGTTAKRVARSVLLEAPSDIVMSAARRPRQIVYQIFLVVGTTNSRSTCASCDSGFWFHFHFERGRFAFWIRVLSIFAAAPKCHAGIANAQS